MTSYAVTGLVGVVAFASFLMGDDASSDAERFWAQWRGPYMTGVSRTADPPIEWNEQKNLRWKVEISGRGSGSPVVWGERIFLLTAIPIEKDLSAPPGAPAAPVDERGRHPQVVSPTSAQAFVALSLRRRDGSVEWQRTLREEFPHEGTHKDGGFASGSAMTDGEHVYAFFGSRGLYCLDMEGRLKWEKDLGDMAIRRGFGEGTTPVLHGDQIVVKWDHQGQSFIVALDKKTGEEIWKTERDEITSWTTPVVVEHGGGAQVLTSATNRVRSYDFATGKLVWESKGVTLNAIPSPVAAEGMAFLTSGFQGAALYAVSLAEARGDITGSKAIVWSYEKDTPYVPSPLLYDGMLYILKSNSGILSCFDALTGEKYFGPERVEGLSNVYASPVGAAGRVYITGREGTTVVLRKGPKLELLAVNKLDDGIDASPALVDGEIYLRGSRYLYSVRSAEGSVP